jgi:hypothetical protein
VEEDTKRGEGLPEEGGGKMGFQSEKRLNGGDGNMANSPISPRLSGETRVVFFGGDYIHNGVGQERYLREIPPLRL